MKQRIYIDTSVIGGCFDAEFEEWSNWLFNDFKAGRMIAVVSDITLDELTDAPQRVQDVITSIPDEYLEIAASEKNSRDLADKYINEKAVSVKFYEDAMHIAIATIYQVNVLASWNFKHIVNLERIRMYNSVNLKNGYLILEIRTPREILKFEENEE
jgi:hypothetical protein